MELPEELKHVVEAKIKYPALLFLMTIEAVLPSAGFWIRRFYDFVLIPTHLRVAFDGCGRMQK